MSNLRGKVSKWAYSALMANDDASPSWTIFKSTIRAMYQPPNNEVLLQARFFSTTGETLSARVCAGDAFAVCVHYCLFQKGAKDDGREQLKLPWIEEKSYNIFSATAYYTPSAEKLDATPMELGNADVVCYK
ncbi:unnamed protein product [Peronospora farinosa]|uniref:Uncharacterized protein n=1 Tax=Peronospora farinosa TaxID=134698 RepID=A0ABN8BYK7_9STRA|nr:unnamed protein product [Peronospora farinosa]